MQMFEVVVFFKLRTLQKQTMKGTTYLLPVGRILPATQDVYTHETVIFNAQPTCYIRVKQ